MAVANSKRRVPKPYELILEDGQVVNVMACRGAQTVGDEKALERMQREFVVIRDRIAYLMQQAVQAPDDKEYKSKLRYVEKFERDFGDLEPQVDATLLLVLADWDMALTEEDEQEANYVPLTTEGLLTIERTLKFDVFSKLMEKFQEENEEKKEFSASTPAGIPARVNSEPAPTGASTTKSPLSTEQATRTTSIAGQ